MKYKNHLLEKKRNLFQKFAQKSSDRIIICEHLNASSSLSIKTFAGFSVWQMKIPPDILCIINMLKTRKTRTFWTGPRRNKAAARYLVRFFFSFFSLVAVCLGFVEGSLALCLMAKRRYCAYANRRYKNKSYMRAYGCEFMWPTKTYETTKKKGKNNASRCSRTSLPFNSVIQINSFPIYNLVFCFPQNNIYNVRPQ